MISYTLFRFIGVLFRARDNERAYAGRYNVLSSEVFTVMTVQAMVFFIVTSRSLLESYERFGGTHCVHLEGRRDPENIPRDGENLFLRNGLIKTC
jgi:hypothetical protein